MKKLFIHIPKTAGTSIKDAFNIYEVKKARRDVCVNIDKYSIINFGHASFIELQKHKIIQQDNLFKFCFIRNPWDRLVSLYFYHKMRNHLPLLPNTFTGLCHALSDIKIPPVDWTNVDGWAQFNPQSTWVEDVDYIGRFESLQEDVNKLADILQIDYVKLRVLNSFLGDKRYKRKDDHYRSCYNDATKNIIGDYYKQDIELGNYSF